MKVIDDVKDKFEQVMKRGKHVKSLAMLVDGPNILRREFNISLIDLKNELEQYGQIKIAKVYLDPYAPEKLIEAVTTLGFEPVITCTDVDVTMAVDATEIIFNENIDVIALVTRDADFQPVVRKAKMHGKETVVAGAEPGFSSALKNTADYVLTVSELR